MAWSVAQKPFRASSYCGVAGSKVQSGLASLSNLIYKVRNVRHKELGFGDSFVQSYRLLPNGLHFVNADSNQL